MQYTDYLDKLFQLKSPNKQNLNALRYASSRLGHPGLKFESIHVAGTNGKGSVTTKIAKACTLNGMRTGLFTSPHIHSFRERMRIDNVPISEEDLTSIAGHVFQTIEAHGLKLYFFEITTLIAFLYFAQQKVDIAVIETGVGGRLDATNIITPQLSIITSIGLDHTETLGTTLEEIATEKAGIIKPNVPVIIGPHVPLNVVAPIAAAQEAPLRQVEGHFESYLEENTAIAKSGMEWLKIPEEIQQEALKMLPPCRLETHTVKGVTVILDVAHNPNGLKSLFDIIERNYPKHTVHIVVGLSKNKDVAGCLDVLIRPGHFYYPVEALGERGIPAKHLAAAFDTSVIPSSIANAVTSAMQSAGAGNGPQLVVICGSFYIMSEALQALEVLKR